LELCIGFEVYKAYPNLVSLVVLTIGSILTAWPLMLQPLVLLLLPLLQVLLMLLLLLQQLLLLLPEEQWHGSPNGPLVGQIGLPLVLALIPIGIDLSPDVDSVALAEG